MKENPSEVKVVVKVEDSSAMETEPITAKKPEGAIQKMRKRLGKK